MKIIEIKNEPIYSIYYENLSYSGKIEFKELIFYDAIVDNLPESIDAIVCTSDLQGIIRNNDNTNEVLLGIHIVNEIALLLEVYGIARVKNTGIILAGDFFVKKGLSGRGGLGFVDEIWYAFSDKFMWVAGVAGNHDNFRDSFPKNKNNIFFFENSIENIFGISIGGISGIIANSTKRKYRYSEDYFRFNIEKILNSSVDILLLHQNIDYRKLMETSKIEYSNNKIIIFGHKQMEPFFKFDKNNIQIINTHEKVVIIRKNKR